MLKNKNDSKELALNLENEQRSSKKIKERYTKIIKILKANQREKIMEIINESWYIRKTSGKHL